MVRAPEQADATLSVIVREVTRVTRPELVLLFGSRATGEPHEDSDYDLMVVFADGTDVEQERRACSSALSAQGVSADVLARTASEYRRQQHDAGYLDWLVSREGRVLYSSGALAQRVPAPRVREGGWRDGVSLWRERAASDLHLAEQSANSATPVPDAICFHAHAAIEKLLKANIAASGVFPPRIHDLARLLVMQDHRLRDDVELAAACALLQKLYPRSRYPELRMPSLAEARDALGAARTAHERLSKARAS